MAARSALMECGGSSHRFSLNSQQLFVDITITKKRYGAVLRRFPLPRIRHGRKAVAAAAALKTLR